MFTIELYIFVYLDFWHRLASILVNIYVNIEIAAEIYLSKIAQKSLRIHWCPESMMKITHILESLGNRSKTTCFFLDFSQLWMYFSSVCGIFLELAVIYKNNLVFRLYNKRNKPMYAQAKKPYAHRYENLWVWDKNQHFTCHLFFRLLEEISCSTDLPFFECLKLISEYSDHSFLEKGNNSKT